ncbi:MAG: sulfatase-like hydrolase/transferase [Myxococcota bacterium]|nr:sulfatase-like hydrolase/transferase [Myxococcota bacterium]
MLLKIPSARYRSLRDALRADVGRAIAMAAGGALLFAPVEYALTLYAHEGTTPLESKLRLVALVATLSLYLFFVLAFALAGVMAATRLVRMRIDRDHEVAPGLFAHAKLQRGVRPGVPRVWAAVATGLVVLLVVQRTGTAAMLRFKEPQLTAALIAAIAVVASALAYWIYRGLAVCVRVGADALAFVGVANPLGRWRACGIAVAGLVGGALAATWYLVPPSRSVMPVRLVISACVIAIGTGWGAHVHGVMKRSTITPTHRRARARFVATCGGALAFMTLVFWGADLGTKYMAITGSPALDKLVRVVRLSNDLDRDGFGSLLGEGDCAPFSRATHPGARDVPGNSRDENCDGRDFSLADITPPPGEKLPVPPQFAKDWNILLLTIDTIRYDHTTFGGYAKGPKKRDTTPRLAKLVEESTNFTWAMAPAAGTMASIPAILTSKFFHSGIAIDEKRPAGTPPGIMPENTLLPEIVKRAGYRTGVIGSHVWWNGWGLEQGVDDYDNSLAKTDDPKRVVADKITNHALAWIAKNQGRKWFLWAHYIDPHGHYIAHPEIVDWGSSDPDLYDAEIKWTDREVGRLLDELRRLPSHDNTIVIITSDHGESMGEHGQPLGTHGAALYTEQIHVPMIFFIPNNKPRSIAGAVSNLDIVPTVAELVGAKVSDLSFEGRSLVPQLFYGKEDLERVVFAETNAGGKQRAAIGARWKLIYYIANNIYELFDTHADPGEKQNLAPQDPPELQAMKRKLEAWMDRVLYARDPLFNQAFRQMADVIVQGAPAPEVPTTGQTLPGIEIVGIGPAVGKPLVAGEKADVHVYFRVDAPTAASYKFQLVVWPTELTTPLTEPLPATSTVRTGLRATADGAYPTERWRSGDVIRERFPVVIPPEWKTAGVTVGLVVVDAAGNRVAATGAKPPNDPQIFSLGVLPLGSSPPGKP